MTSNLLVSKQHPPMLFPSKLHRMLSQIEQDGFDHIISWQPHGRCFVLHKPDEFQAFVLSRYFDTNKMASFQRQLCLYGFTRLSKGRDKGGYYHELFLRGRPDLVDRISRKVVKGTRYRARANGKDEPNFWLMSWVGVPTSNNNPKLKENKSTVLSRPRQSTEPQHLVTMESPTTIYPTSIVTSAERAATDDCCGNIASFAGRNFHSLESSSAVAANGLLSNLQSLEVDFKSSLEDSIKNDDDFISLLKCIASS